MKHLFLGLVSIAALAQSVDELELPAPPAPDFTFKLGGKVDSAGGSDVLGKVTWNATRALTLALSGNRSNLASTTQAPSPSGNATVTTTGSFGGTYAAGLFSLGLQFDQSNMSDLLMSRRYYLQPALDGGSWRFGLELSTRRTDFDRLQFRSINLNTPSGPVTLSGYTDLNLSDTGLGANFDLTGDVWRFYGSYTHYSYGSFEGTTDVTRIRNSNGTVSPEIFKLLYARVVSRIERVSASRLSNKAALLDSTATVGLEADLLRSRWSVDVSQDVDHLTGEISDTYTGIAAWKVNPRWTLELQIGATHSEAFGTDRFAGLYILYRTSPRL